MRLTNQEIEVMADLLAGHTWTSSVDLAGLSSVEASSLRGRLPLAINERDRLHNPRGFARWLPRQAFYEPTRPIQARSRYSKPRGAKGHGLDVAAVRAWADQEQLTINAFGPLSKHVIEAYIAAHPTQEISHARTDADR
jgi:hypothetical protein